MKALSNLVQNSRPKLGSSPPLQLEFWVSQVSGVLGRRPSSAGELRSGQSTWWSQSQAVAQGGGLGISVNSCWSTHLEQRKPRRLVHTKGPWTLLDRTPPDCSPLMGLQAMEVQAQLVLQEWLKPSVRADAGQTPADSQPVLH